MRYCSNQLGFLLKKVTNQLKEASIQNKKRSNHQL